MGLDGQADQKIVTLSGGQRRRLDVAVGIIGQPELLFLNEPTVGFDPHARREFHELVQRLSGHADTTILLTTHDLAEAEKLADRLLILAAGSIVADGSADELARRVAGESEVRRRPDGQRFARSTADATGFHPASPAGDSCYMTSVNAERRPTVTSYGAEVKTVKAIFEGSCSRAERPLPSRSNSNVTANVVESVSKESAVSSAGVVEVARGPGAQARADGPSRHSGSGAGHLRTSMTGELTNAIHSAFPGAGDPAQSTPQPPRPPRATRAQSVYQSSTQAGVVGNHDACLSGA